MTHAELLAELQRLVAEATASRERLREVGAALGLLRRQLSDDGNEAESAAAPSA